MTEDSCAALNALEWHDAVLLSVVIDRGEPGEHDSVRFLIEWDGIKRELLFEDCYALDLRMSFGVIGPESILEARCVTDSIDLAAIRAKWLGVGISLEDLACFEMKTNSTGSVLRVFARRISLLER